MSIPAQKMLFVRDELNTIAEVAGCSVDMFLMALVSSTHISIDNVLAGLLFIRIKAMPSSVNSVVTNGCGDAEGKDENGSLAVFAIVVTVLMRYHRCRLD